WRGRPRPRVIPMWWTLLCANPSMAARSAHPRIDLLSRQPPPRHRFTIVVMVIFSLVAWLRFWPQWPRRIRSRNWPTALGRIEGGDVSVMRDGRREIETCTVNCSYQVAGEYGGKSSQHFGDEQPAYHYIDTRKRAKSRSDTIRAHHRARYRSNLSLRPRG